MEQTSIFFADHTRERLNVLAPSALVLIPLGAVEQHGPHLPTGTDYYTVDHLAREAAKLLQPELPVLVTPALAFGSSDHHLPFGGTLSLSTQVYYSVLVDLLRSLSTCGFRRIFFLNGHGGNHEIMQLAARDLALQKKIAVGAASYWNLAWDALIATGAHEFRLPGHAGRFETSLMLALRNECVSLDRPRRDDALGSDPRGFSPMRIERHGSWQEIDGYSDSPASASAELGQSYLRVIVSAVASSLRDFYRTALPT